MRVQLCKDGHYESQWFDSISDAAKHAAAGDTIYLYEDKSRSLSGGSQLKGIAAMANQNQPQGSDQQRDDFVNQKVSEGMTREQAETEWNQQQQSRKAPPQDPQQQSRR